MKRSISILAVLFLMVLVHVDWHLGRAHHHRLSMEWEYHWITGLVGFFLMVLIVARKRPENLALAAALNVLLGLFLGQIVEPLLEVLGYRVSVATALPPERWMVFFQFCIAGLVGFIAGILWIRVYRRKT
jgi:uncharacterized YccA/Bax inhibitor family protein